MSKDKRTGWLAELRVGDAVVVSWRASKALGTVASITPTGRITLKDRQRFSHTGRSFDGGAWSRSYLLEATPEAVASIRADAALRRFVAECRKVTSTTDATTEAFGRIREAAEAAGIVGGGQ